MQNSFTRRILVAYVLASVLACGGVSLQKQQAILSAQSVESALGAAQDFEQTLYTGGVVPSADHQKAVRVYDQAFGDMALVWPVLKAWQPGQPVPASLADLMSDAQAALSLANALAPSTNATVLTGKVTDWINAINQVEQIIQSTAQGVGK